MRTHIGTFITGLVFLAIGVAFALEAAGVWTVRVQDLKLIGPLALVVIGAAVLLSALTRRNT